VMLIAQAS
jgi:hypothetical protein